MKGAQSARTGRKVIPPNDERLAVIVDTIEPRFRALIYLAAEAGLRYGEATLERTCRLSPAKEPYTMSVQQPGNASIIAPDWVPLQEAAARCGASPSGRSEG